jgi:hypothetical protein
LLLRYYCTLASVERPTVEDLLLAIEHAHGVHFEVNDLGGTQDSEREAYERDFKPQARILSKRTGSTRGIPELRGRRSGRYYLSIPGTIAIVEHGRVQWYTLGAPEIIQFLKEVLTQGKGALESRLH